MNRWWCSFALVAVVFLMSAPKAEAKILFYGYGDSIMKIGEVSAETKKRLETLSRIVRARSGRTIPTDYKIGYKYSYFSLMFMNMWTWKGAFVLYRKRRFIPLTEKRAKLYKIKLNSLSKPFSYRFPTGLLVVLGIVLVFVVLGVMGGGEEAEAGDEEAERLLRESRGQS